MLIRELDQAETGAAYPVIRELRPRLSTMADFLAAVDRQRQHGYRLIAALDSEQRAVAAAGFRSGECLAWGSYLYIDDLCTLPRARGNGYASELLRWIAREAAASGVGEIHLDSGNGRHAAHRLYASSGFTAPSTHFVRKLSTANAES
ncbi:Acetyltransferase (GNAT) family protein [Actinopolyspora alba]|uniref:Acetyltransferase (GNAT) family protein n=1 Tax=Actinopolyspora alba TaxID=673379 RepID=A0A1I2B6U8_9ACTN|nr:GNAT family N-acetyltransferase [Actinopolyspora alba]SFE51043.1 Acetyltransferase (GNAT) family protein [Actinopolyspora alba]